MIEISNVIDIESQEQLTDLVSTGKTVVVDFHAPSWCQPCKKLHPHFVKTAEQLDDIIFATVDIDKQQWAPEEYDFMTVPTVKMIRNGMATEVKGRTVVQLVNEIGG